MKKMRLAAALGIVSIMAGATGFIACSSSDSSNPPPAGGDGSTDSGSQNQPDGGGPNYDSGVLTPDPGVVACGSQSCSTTGQTAQFCCLNDAGATCNSKESDCKADSIEAYCDEAADCTGSDICCGKLSATDQKLKIQCTAESNCKQDQFTYQVCKTDAECTNDAGCKVQNCAGAIVHTCGGIQNSNCTPVQ